MSYRNLLNLKDEQQIFELIKSSLDLFKGPNFQLGNNYLTGELNSSTFERKSYLLGNLLDEKRNYNLKLKLKCLRYSHGLKENRYFNVFSDIMRDLKRSHKSNEDLLHQFFQRLDKYLESIRQKPIFGYKLIFPINLNFKKGVLVEFLQRNRDLKIKLVDNINEYYPTIWEYINQHYPSNGLPERNENVRNLLSSCHGFNIHYFIVESHARNVSFAVKQASRELGANLGLYLFVQLEGRGILHLSPGPFPSEHSMTKVRMPVVYVIQNQVCEFILFKFYEKFSNPQDISLQDLKNIAGDISFINKIKNSKLRLLLYEAFNYYYDALTSTKYSTAFMSFWNIIEMLFLKSKDLTLKTIVHHLKSTFPEGTDNKKDMEQLIDIMLRKRNLYVHESKDTITSEDRDYLKIIVE
ncbi:MAG: hypothetical protein EU533_09280, partial [Promethearchaeota archaeon]